MMKHIFKNNKEHYTYGGLYGSSGSYILGKIAREFNTVFIVLSNNSEIVNLSKELKIFLHKDTKLNQFFDLESFPYESTIYDNEVISGRLFTYYNLMNYPKNVIITTSNAISKKILPKESIVSYFYYINLNNKYDEIINTLVDMQYERTERVLNKGEFSVRGPIIDIYSPIHDKPMRVTFDDIRIETIKEIEIESQQSMNEVSSLIICAAKEIIINDEMIKSYKSKSKKIFDDEYLDDIEFNKITNHLFHPSIYNVLPLLYKKLDTIFDLVNSKDNIILTTKNIDCEIKNISQRYDEYYKKYKEEQYILNPKLLLMNHIEYEKISRLYQKVELSVLKVNDNPISTNSSIRRLPTLLVNNTYKEPFQNFRDFVKRDINKLVIFVDRKSLKLEIIKVLNDLDLKYQIYDNYLDKSVTKDKILIIEQHLEQGYIDYAEKIAIVTAKDIFGSRSVSKPHKNKNRLMDNYINDISSLEVNSPVVHDNYGVGRYKGLINMDVEGIKTELIKIEYSDDDILYIPITSINLLKKYTGHTGLNIPLHSLGTDNWIKIKSKAKKRINDIAVELLEIESKRLASKGYIFKKDLNEYDKFVEYFPFTETEDQTHAINDVLYDMQSNKPMDRLICGDVGFGKTEIIMRAAFIAASNNVQTMILAPTTILVEQHYKSFIKRFSETAINISKLSRLQKIKEKKDTIDKLKSGAIDIIIGTHALLSKNIEFKEIKLLIIDEEHKFGVADKEKIKKLKHSIDVITLTATPIPRTLNSALSQIKDLSIIETPPQNRKSIVTRIIKWNKEIIKEAIEREMQRGGQVYFVHNEIQSMDEEISNLNNLLSNIKIGKIHGQLDAKHIEGEMEKFVNREYDVLVCTSIIESGLDIQNVNTIIINHSSKFGLAQLHQIRGRVGRTNRQAYAYLIIGDKNNLTKEAERRLEAIDSVDSLGGGLELSTHDLEIRGAGEILGAEQSGQIYEIGYAMFTDMLNKSIEFLKDGDIANNIDNIEIDNNYSCLITEDYMSDVLSRLKYYKKISSCENEKDIIRLKDELIDIYGPIPEYLDNLLSLTILKLKLKNQNIKYMKIIDNLIKIEFKNKDLIKIDNIVSSTKNMDLKIMKNNMIQLKVDAISFDSLCDEIANIIAKF